MLTTLILSVFFMLLASFVVIVLTVLSLLTICKMVLVFFTEKLGILFFAIVLILLPVTANSTAIHSKGIASWYGPNFHGKKTASGERYNMYAMTAAHKTLKFGTKVRVTNLKNNKTVVVIINDRGPFKPGRVIDLSKSANKQIDCHLCKVKLEIIK